MLQAALAPLRRRRLRGLRDRGLVDRHRRAAPGRRAHRAWRCSPTSRRTTSTTTAHGRLLGRQARAVRLAGPARGGGQRRRRARRRAGRRAAGGALDVWTYSRAAARRAAARARPRATTTAAWPSRCTRATSRRRCAARLIGDYNAHNLLAVIGGAARAGRALADAAAVVPQLTPVPGRMQRVGDGARARRRSWSTTPTRPTRSTRRCRRCARWPRRAAAGWSACSAAAATATRRKRPLMGAIAARRRRPRGRHQRQPARRGAGGRSWPRSSPASRRAARRRHRRPPRGDRAGRRARPAPRDVVLVAGKGHEDYQEIAGVQPPVLRRRRGARGAAAQGRA